MACAVSTASSVKLTQEQIWALVQRIEVRVKEYATDPKAEELGLNSYDAIEAVLREEFGQ